MPPTSRGQASKKCRRRPCRADSIGHRGFSPLRRRRRRGYVAKAARRGSAVDAVLESTQHCLDVTSTDIRAKAVERHGATKRPVLFRDPPGRLDTRAEDVLGHGDDASSPGKPIGFLRAEPASSPPARERPRRDVQREAQPADRDLQAFGKRHQCRVRKPDLNVIVQPLGRPYTVLHDAVPAKCFSDASRGDHSGIYNTAIWPWWTTWVERILAAAASARCVQGLAVFDGAAARSSSVITTARSSLPWPAAWAAA